MPPMSRRGALLLLVGTTLTGCSTTGPKDDSPDMNLTSMNAAVKESSPRVLDVLFSSRETNGFGHALYIGVMLDSPTPPTTEELDPIVEAIWTDAPWEPNAIRIVAVAGPDKEPVDVLSAAEGLTPMEAGTFGQKGVSLVAMSERYGAWKAPA